MASFSYKFSSVEDINNSLFLTWESGYTSLKVYHKGKLIKEIATAQELLRGVNFDHEELSNISIQLAKEKPMIIKVNVNKQEYLPENNLTGRGEINMLINAFWWLFGLAIIGSFIEVFSVIDYMDNIQMTTLVIVDSLIIASYGFTAMMLKREYAWSYFIGTTVFVLISIFFVYNTFQFNSNVGVIIGILLRGLFAFIIFKHFPIIMRMMKSSHKVDNYDLLDDF